MMDLLGAGNPYMARRFAEGGEVDPFLQTPGYISLSEQLAGVKSETQREREEYGKKMQALEDQWRSLAGLSEAPESVRNPIVEQLRSEYEASIAPARERSTEMARYYGDLANRITNYLETARPGQTLELPRNTFSRRGGSQPYNFVLDDPNNPFTYEQRKAYTDQGYSVVGRDFISDYLQNQILPKQQQAQESIDYYADPNAYMRGREKDYEERLAQALGEYRTAEQRKVEAQQQALKDYIIPLVDKAYQTEEGLQGQIAALRRSFVPMDKAQGTLLMPTEPLTPAPSQQAPVTAAPTPAPAPSIPVPSLPTNVPVPVSNLSPVPAPGIGQRVPSVIPQPGIGALPAYQTPTAQAQRPMQQQQIQYGPIGQASTSSADLLKNLLAATQQSSPYDFTKNNPYLMQNQPVQFFAEGGEVAGMNSRAVASDLWQQVYRPKVEEELAPLYAELESFKNKYAQAQAGEANYVNAAIERAKQGVLTDYQSRANSFLDNALTLEKTPAEQFALQMYGASSMKDLLAKSDGDPAYLNMLLKDAEMSRQSQIQAARGMAQSVLSDGQIAADMFVRDNSFDIGAQAAEQYRREYLDPIDKQGNQLNAQVMQAESQLYDKYGREALLPPPLVETKPMPLVETKPMPLVPTTSPTPPSSVVPTPALPPPTPAIPSPGISQPALPSQPQAGSAIPSQPSAPSLTPQPMPGVTTPQPVRGGIPQPGIFGVLPTYQTQASSPTAQAQQPQQQIQYGPIGQGAVGQANLLNTLLANQQDPTKVSLLGFDNPYLMKPFG